MTTVSTDTEELAYADNATHPGQPLAVDNAYVRRTALTDTDLNDFAPQYQGTQFSTYMYIAPSAPYHAQTDSAPHAESQIPGANGLYPARASGQAGSFTYVASPLQQPHVQIRWESHFPTHDGAPYDSHDILAHSYPSPSVTSHRPRSSADSETLRDPCQPNNLYPTLPPLPGPPPAAPQHNEYPPGTVRCQWDRGCEDPVEGASPSGIGRHLRRFHDISMTDNRLRQRCQWGVDCGKTLFASNLGKHIAECHLRSLTKQCPHCGADFARADTLTRHIKGFCASRAAHTETTRT